MCIAIQIANDLFNVNRISSSHTPIRRNYSFGERETERKTIDNFDVNAILRLRVQLKTIITHSIRSFLGFPLQVIALLTDQILCRHLVCMKFEMLTLLTEPYLIQ